MSRVTHIPFILAFTISLCGCQMFGNHNISGHHKHFNQSTPEFSPAVDVGGDVVHPGRIDVREEGLTLRRALALSGGVRPSAMVGNVNVDPGIPEDVIAQVEKLAKEAGWFADILRDPQLKDVVPQDEFAKRKEIAERALDEFMGSLPVAVRSKLRQLQRTAAVLGSVQGLVAERSSRLGLPPTETQQGWLKKYTEDLEKEKADVVGSSNNSTQLNWAPPSPDTYLVAVQRAATNQAPETYYFPYDLALSGAVGEIALIAGDLVQVIDYRMTSLDPTRSEGTANVLKNKEFLVKGYVRAPGIKEIKTGAMGMYQVIDEEVGKALPIDPANATWTVVRDSIDGTGRDVFVLPQRYMEGAFRTARVIPGDVYTYNTIHSVPLVFESLARRTLQFPKPDELREEVLANRTLGERFRDHQLRHEQHVIADGGIGSRTVGLLSAAHRTSNMRTGGTLPLAQSSQ